MYYANKKKLIESIGSGVDVGVVYFHLQYT